VGDSECLIKLKTRYPWEGCVDIGFTLGGGPAEFCYGFRIPGWCTNYRVELNGEKITPDPVEGYARIHRQWRTGDRLTLIFDMPVNVAEANPHVRQNAGKAAVTRGPIVYCLEEADNGKDLCGIRLGKSEEFMIHHESRLLEGVTVITCTGKKLKDWEKDELYRIQKESGYEKKPLRFIPYYAWANRGYGEMTVWVNA
jgi:DUF1680 family protein